MSYETGVLVRRQQREYPQALREEIALMAIKLSNNREVARVYSQKLGYTVNESTIRGIKKRYLEAVTKGKISAPSGLVINSLSPRSSTLLPDTPLPPSVLAEIALEAGESYLPHNLVVQTSSADSTFSESADEIVLEGTGEGIEIEEGEESYYQTSEDPQQVYLSDEESDLIEPQSMMKLQIEVLEGNMKEEIQDNESNGGYEDSGPLSIDDREPDSTPKPSIRINKGIQIQANSALKRKASEMNGSPAVAPIVRKIRPSNTENEADIVTLEKEIKALHWLARRKEQEWDQVIRLLKQKEEKLMIAQRNKVLIRADSDHMLARSIVIPKKNTLIINATATATVTTTTQPNSRLTEDKINSALQKANVNLEKESSGVVTNVTTTTRSTTKTPVPEENGSNPATPQCQGCKKKKSEFVCAGCSNRWYCSRDCQVEDWDDHADDCSG